MLIGSADKSKLKFKLPCFEQASPPSLLVSYPYTSIRY